MSVPRKILCTVDSITNHGEHVYILDLAPTLTVPLFRPGQFLHLTVDAYDPSGYWPESRVFSIASSPRDRSRLRICYSVVGRYTARMEQKVRMGSTVWVKLPYGDFVIDDSQDVVLLAGGTGISAFTAFLELLHPENPHGVTLVYGARKPALFLFTETILSQLERVPNLNAVFFSEADSADFHRQMGAIPKELVFPGRISMDLLWPLLEEPARKQYYLSGPPFMLRDLSTGLMTHGVPPDQIRTDAWE